MSQSGVNEELGPSVVGYLPFKGRKTFTAIKETHPNPKKLEKLAERQDQPLVWKSERSVSTIVDIDLPHWIQQLKSR